jgi:uncharacterized RDD family membrane protein YckC
VAKQRFRNLKQNRPKEAVSKNKYLEKNDEYASVSLKIKAFLTDAFMLLMPIMYIVFYLVMDGREDFANHKMFGWIAILLPLIIVQTIFMYFTGQTPGYRAYHITLIDERSKKKPSLAAILFRNVCAILSLFTIVGWVLMFFRKDKKTLHDLLSATAVVNKP